MNAAQRRMEIFRILQDQVIAEVTDLSERLEVSTMTIRRDLALFEKQGLVVTSYGGAYLNKGAGIEPSFALKQGQMADVKQYIAREAAELVKDGDSVVLDCGTSPLQIVKYLLKKRITIITNSWPVINHIQGGTKIKLILAPGEYSEISAGVISTATIEFYKNIYADIVFMGTMGFSERRGATVADAADADVKRAVLRSAKSKVILVDHSKFDKDYLFKYAEPTDFDTIITDSRAEAGYVEKLGGVCKSVLVAREKRQRTAEEISQELEQDFREIQENLKDLEQIEKELK